MFGILKFIYGLFQQIVQLLDPDRNPLRYAPPYVRYLTSIILAWLWCISYGLYFGELLTVGYNIFGHVAIIGMVFVTLKVFKETEKTYGSRCGTTLYLTMPDRLPKCYDMTDEEKLNKMREWNARNVWNTPALAEYDHPDRRIVKIYQ